MPQVYVRLVLLPLALFSAALLLMRTQFYDDHDLRELLLPEGCPAPCFMGIRPGVTTMDEAMRILEGSDWVASYEFDPKQGALYIKWSPNSPRWLKNNGFYGGSSIGIQDGIVYGISLDTTLK